MTGPRSHSWWIKSRPSYSKSTCAVYSRELMLKFWVLLWSLLSLVDLLISYFFNFWSVYLSSRVKGIWVLSYYTNGFNQNESESIFRTSLHLHRAWVWLATQDAQGWIIYLCRSCWHPRDSYPDFWKFTKGTNNLKWKLILESFTFGFGICFWYFYMRWY